MVAIRKLLPGAVAFGLLALGLTAPVHSADARVYVGLGFGFGAPVWGPGYYYPPPAYAYPYGYAPAYPGYYPPGPAAQPVPAPAYQAPAAQAPAVQAPAQGYSTDNCRDYSSTQTIDGQPQAVTGTACQQPDGSWRIVR